MTRPVPPKVAAGASNVTTRPIYIVEFDSSLRFSSREQVTYNGNTYVSAGLNYTGSSIAVYNENGQFTRNFMLARGTITATVRVSYGESPFVDADWYVDFDGEAGAVEFTDWITLELKPTRAQRQPHYTVGRPVFNHLPARGSKIMTPTGIYVLEPKK